MATYLSASGYSSKQNKWAANELNMRKNAQKMRNRKNDIQLTVSHLCFQHAPPQKNGKKILSLTFTGVK